MFASAALVPRRASYNAAATGLHTDQPSFAGTVSALRSSLGCSTVSAVEPCSSPELCMALKCDRSVPSAGMRPDRCRQLAFLSSRCKINYL